MFFFLQPLPMKPPRLRFVWRKKSLVGPRFYSTPLPLAVTLYLSLYSFDNLCHNINHVLSVLLDMILLPSWKKEKKKKFAFKWNSDILTWQCQWKCLTKMCYFYCARLFYIFPYNLKILTPLLVIGNCSLFLLLPLKFSVFE